MTQILIFIIGAIVGLLLARVWLTYKLHNRAEEVKPANDKKLIITLIVGLLIIAGLAAVLVFVKAPGEPAPADGQKRTVTLYFYDANKDKDAAGNIQCSAQGLVPQEHQILVSQTPIQDTIKLWLAEQLPEVELRGANLANGVLTLEFSDPQNKTGGGSCRVTILWKQIEATAKQFPGVAQVRFLPEELFQP